jgi:hypothetical protein
MSGPGALKHPQAPSLCFAKMPASPGGRLGGIHRRYRSFLALKTVLAVAIPALLWMEAAAVLGERMEGGVRLPFSGVLPALAFLPVCACAIWWSFADRRRRCPACLQRLSVPVSMGAWAGVPDPATTELVRDFGHGWLCDRRQKPIVCPTSYSAKHPLGPCLPWRQPGSERQKASVTVADCPS